MAEKIQHNAALMRVNMHHRYDDGLHHKHNKCHLTYRQHWPSHPVITTPHPESERAIKAVNQSTGLVGEKNLKKTRLRLLNATFTDRI